VCVCAYVRDHAHAHVAHVASWISISTSWCPLPIFSYLLPHTPCFAACAPHSMLSLFVPHIPSASACAPHTILSLHAPHTPFFPCMCPKLQAFPAHPVWLLVGGCLHVGPVECNQAEPFKSRGSAHTPRTDWCTQHTPYGLHPMD